jgi:predicted nucleotidyltransferase component of viral defense system
MFRLEDTEIAKAVDRCKEVKPTVRVVSFGEYTVTSSKNDGTTYTVKCYRDQQGFKTIDCNCKAGERDHVCFHAMAAVALHLYMAAVQMVIRRRAARLARTRK